MEADFWHSKWESGVIGFHRAEPNPLLVANFKALALKESSRVFLPLCGKTLDIGWLLSEGYCVVGIELSEIAVKQLFEQLNLTPEVTEIKATEIGATARDKLQCYSAENIDIFVGDFFHLTQQALGVVDAIYDRAAFVALPEDMRIRYATHLIHLTDGAPQLLVSFEYDQSQLAGPPFATSNQEIFQHYQAPYDLSLIASQTVDGGLKGKCEAIENVWLLKQADRAHVFNEKEVIRPPRRGKWKIMLPVLALLIVGGWFVYQYDVDTKVAAGGAVLVGFYSGLISWVLGMIALVPIIGPFLVKILTMSFIWLLNAVGYFVSYIAIKRGYAKDVITYRGLTIALIVGMVIGYVLGSL